MFTFIFTVEAIIKIIGMSKEYFKVGWNIFDLLIVACSLPDMVIFVLDAESVQALSEVAGVVKVFRLVIISLCLINVQLHSRTTLSLLLSLHRLMKEQ